MLKIAELNHKTENLNFIIYFAQLHKKAIDAVILKTTFIIYFAQSHYKRTVVQRLQLASFSRVQY